MTSVFLTILFFCVIITVHETGHFLAAKILKQPVKEFSIGFGPPVLKFAGEETRYFLRAFPICGYVKFKDNKQFEKISIRKRIAIIIAGPISNVLTGFLAISLVFLVQGKYNSTRISSVISEESGFEVGDVIEKVNDRKILCASDCVFELSRISRNSEADVTVNRNGESLKISNALVDGGLGKGSGKSLGVCLGVENLNVANFFRQVFLNSIFLIKVVLVSFLDLIMGKLSVGRVSGIVGFKKAVDEAKTVGVGAVMFLFPFLSINIGIFNLLPFPALDGGRFLFLLIEAVFRRPINRKIQNALNFFGVFILLFSIIIITMKDILMLFY